MVPSADPIFAYVRCNKLRTPNALANAELHGFGDTPINHQRRRDGATHRALALALDSDGRLTGGVDSKHGFGLRAAFDRHLKQTGAKLRKNAPRALHLLVGISPEWVDGDRYDPTNPQVRSLVTHATRWAEKSLGGVFAVRYDVDEVGSVQVDVLAAPVHEAFGKPFVSTHKSLSALQRRWKQKTEYGALQDSWAKYAQDNMDPLILRGIPVSETNRKHLTPEKYKTMIRQAQSNLDQILDLSRKLMGEAKEAQEKTLAAQKRAKKYVDEIADLDQMLKKKPWLSGEPHSGRVWQPAPG